MLGMASGIIIVPASYDLEDEIDLSKLTAGIGLFILLPILRVILMLIFFAKERDYKFTAAAAVVLLTIFAGFAIGILAK